MWWNQQRGFSPFGGGFGGGWGQQSPWGGQQSFQGGFGGGYGGGYGYQPAPQPMFGNWGGGYMGYPSPQPRQGFDQGGFSQQAMNQGANQEPQGRSFGQQNFGGAPMPQMQPTSFDSGRRGRMNLNPEDRIAYLQKKQEEINARDGTNYSIDPAEIEAIRNGTPRGQQISPETQARMQGQRQMNPGDQTYGSMMGAFSQWGRKR